MKRTGIIKMEATMPRHNHGRAAAATWRFIGILTTLALALGALSGLRPAVSQAAGPAATGNLIVNGDFSAGFGPWWATASVSPDASSGELAATIINGGANPWDAIVGQNFLPIYASATYTLSFDIHASAAATIVAQLQKEAAPYTQYFQHSVGVTTSAQHVEYVFTSAFDDPAAAFQFQIGGQGTPTIYIDNVVLEGPVAAPPAGPSNLVRNGNFANGLAPWWTAGAVTPSVIAHLAIADGGANPWDVIFGHGGVPVVAGQSYTVAFDAQASAPATIKALLQQDGPPYSAYFGQDVALSTSKQSYEYTFTAAASDPAAAFQFQIGGQGTPTIAVGNVKLTGASGNVLTNGDFRGGLDPWWTAGSVSATLGGVCVAIGAGAANPWDAILGQSDIAIEAGKTYSVAFEASASTPATIKALLQQNGPPYSAYFGQDIALTASTQAYQYAFSAAASDPAAAFQFQIGGNSATTVCLNNVVVIEVPTGVRLNQVGYLPKAPKRATVLHPATTALPWELRDGGGAVVLTGQTSVYGDDSASGDHVHIADFSAYTRTGTGYTLKVGADVSHTFDIGNKIYRTLKYDALAYFYHNRSGIPISLPYAGDAKWTRPAGHVGVAPNQGDTSVTCFDGIDIEGVSWPGCPYTLDVSGGWYDAGDHGKYVVNGGISVWTLLNQYERARYLGHDGALGKLNIPERGNSVPDLLDEARWEIEFLLKMQVPAGQPLAGMVHHKVHDENWTGLALRPDQDPQRRFLYPPSTAATLNMAATAGQCARIWKKLDRAFADRCLHAAEQAWNAAIAHPAEYARDNFTGGGPYNDTILSDEFYWAASELYISTGKAAYKNYLKQSPHFTAIPVAGGTSLSWGDVAALGTISLAIVPNDLPDKTIRQARKHIAAAADSYVAALQSQGYLTPFDPGGTGAYPWGSNSFVLNNLLIMALAYDFSGKPVYLNAVSEGMDYLLGRNPMDKSYISGYGTNPLTNPHHRFWAHQKDASFPPPPPGAASGGPNSGLEDPLAQTRLPGCAPQKCYLDDIDSWSTNEITINWNAPLAWAAAFLDEHARDWPRQ
jgi:endoglucanase